MKTVLIVCLAILGTVALSAPPPINNPTAAKQVAVRDAVRDAVKALRASDDWSKMSTQLDQYTNHLATLEDQVITANAKIALVADAPTKLALNKVQAEVEKEKQMLDDLYVAFKAMKKCLVDTVATQENK